MLCPYPHCGGDVPPSRSATYCTKCGLPAFFCPRCNAPNRAFARFCRACRGTESSISFPPTHAKNLDFESLSKRPKSFVIEDSFWTAPIAHCGSLWCLSLNGVVWKVSPVGPPPTHFATLGEDFGQAPFIIRYVTTGKESGQIPFLFAANTRAVKSVNLLTREVKEIASVADGETILSSLAQTYSTIETYGNSLYFLKAAKGKVLIESRGLLDNSVKSYVIKDLGVVGPFRIGNRLASYSRKALQLIEKDRIVEHSFLNGFTAWVNPGEMVTVQPAAGRMPYVTTGDSVYIPGAKGSTPGLLYMPLDASGAFIAFKEEASYSDAENGSLVVARKGRLALYRGLSAVEVSKDTELIARGPSYHHEPVTIGFAKTAGGVESLRFYYEQRMMDHPLSEFTGFQDGLRVCQVGGTVVFAYLNENNNIGMSVWGC